MFTERDEINASRRHPTAHPLRTLPAARVYEAPTALDEFTMILPGNMPYLDARSLLAAARSAVNHRAALRAAATGVHLVPFVRFWFENQTSPARADFATGDVVSWAENGEITFTDGTRLNDKLLMRVTF